MNRSDILAMIIEIAKENLSKNISINDNSSSEEIAEWDSLKHVLILNNIEEKLDVNFDIDDIIELTTINDIADKVVELKK